MEKKNYLMPEKTHCLWLCGLGKPFANIFSDFFSLYVAKAPKKSISHSAISISNYQSWIGLEMDDMYVLFKLCAHLEQSLQGR